MDIVTLSLVVLERVFFCSCTYFGECMMSNEILCALARVKLPIFVVNWVQWPELVKKHCILFDVAMHSDDIRRL